MDVARLPAQRKQFLPENGQKMPILFAKNNVFLAEVVSYRAPYPILKVPNPLKGVWKCIAATYWVLQGCGHKKEISFRPKMAKDCQFLAENSVFLAAVVSYRAPYPILRVPDPLKRVSNCIGPTYRVLQGRQHKNNSLCRKMAKNCHFLAENSVFSSLKRPSNGETSGYFARFQVPSPYYEYRE